MPIDRPINSSLGRYLVRIQHARWEAGLSPILDANAGEPRIVASDRARARRSVLVRHGDGAQVQAGCERNGDEPGGGGRACRALDRPPARRVRRRYATRMLVFLPPRAGRGRVGSGKGRADDRLIDDGDFNRRKI